VSGHASDLAVVVSTVSDHIVMCVRSCQSEFTTVMVKWQLTSASRDSHLQWRCLAWSWDASMLAVASSCGLIDIYDAVLGMAVCSIPPVSIDVEETSLTSTACLVTDSL